MKNCIRFGVLLLVVSLMSGCSSLKETPTEAVNNAFEAISKRDIETTEKYFANKEFVDDLSSNAPEDDEILGLLFEKLKCQVLSVSETDDTAIVSTKITNIDLGSIFGEYIQTIMYLTFSSDLSSDLLEDGQPDEDEMAKYFLELLKREDNAMNSTIVDIKLNRSNNSWVLEVNDELENAIMGDIAGSMSDMFY